MSFAPEVISELPDQIVVYTGKIDVSDSKGSPSNFVCTITLK